MRVSKRAYIDNVEDPMPGRLMKDELFEAQLLRAIGYAPYGGADASECLAVADRIAGTDLDAWHDAWAAAAARL
jgi:hypothetical protein